MKTVVLRESNVQRKQFLNAALFPEPYSELYLESVRRVFLPVSYTASDTEVKWSSTVYCASRSVSKPRTESFPLVQ